MKVYILYINFGPYDGGMDILGIYSSYEKASAEYQRTHNQIPLIQSIEIGGSITDTVCFIEEWIVDE